MTLFRLDDKVAIVTGAAGGIGRAIAATLAAQGARLALVDINLEGAKQLAEEIGGECQSYGTDVSEIEAIRGLVERVAADFGSIDILVNNAGICPRLPFAASTEEDWERLVSVNAKSQYFMMQAVCPVMKAAGGGRIVNMASSSGRVGAVANASVYSGTKGAIVMFSKSVAREVAADGILVNCVAPACVDTELISNLPPETVQALCEQIPLKRIGRTDEVAAAVAFLASDEASYITGAIVDVTGGMHMP